MGDEYPRATHDELQAFMEEWQELLGAADTFEREAMRALRVDCASWLFPF